MVWKVKTLQHWQNRCFLENGIWMSNIPHMNYQILASINIQKLLNILVSRYQRFCTNFALLVHMIHFHIHQRTHWQHNILKWTTKPVLNLYIFCAMMEENLQHFNLSLHTEYKLCPSTLKQVLSVKLVTEFRFQVITDSIILKPRLCNNKA